MPPPPCNWIAQSMTLQAMLGTATLIIAISAMRSIVTPCWAMVFPKATRVRLRLHISSSMRSANPMSRMQCVDAPWAEPSLRNLEATSFAQQYVGGRHAHIGERDFGRAIGHATKPEHADRPHHLDARRGQRHQDHRLLFVAIEIIGVRLTSPHWTRCAPTSIASPQCG